MSVINFLFGNRTPSGFSLSGVVDFDAELTISELHERSSDVTEHPVESGARVTDHVVRNPDRLRLEGFVSDAGVAVFGAQPGATQDAFEVLGDAHRSGMMFDVVTGYTTYENMVIVRLDMPRERPSSMRFNIEMVSIRVVESQVVEIDAVDEDVADLASPTNDVGRQPTREAGAQTQQRSSSLLADLVGGGA